MGKWRLVKKLSSKRLLLFSLLAVFLVPVLLSMINAAATYGMVKKEIDHNNEVLLESLKRNIDTNLSMLETAMMNIDLMNTTNLMTYADTSRYTGLGSFLDQMQTELHKIKIANPFINEIAIYFINSDYIVTNQTAYTRELLASNYLHNKNISHQGWQYLIGEAGASPKLCLLEDTGAIVFLRILRKEAGRPLAYIAVTINKDELLEQLRANLFHQEAFIAIGGQDRPLVSSNDDVFRILEEPFHPEAEMGGEGRLERAEYTMLLRQSGLYPVYYLYAVPTSVYIQKSQNTAMSIAFTLVAILLLGGAIIPQMIRLNYLPVERLMQRLGGKNSLRDKNEYQYILEEIEKKQLHAQDQKENLMRVLLSCALTSQISRKEQEMLEKYLPAKEEARYYCLLIREDEQAEGQMQSGLLHFAVGNVLSELLGTRFQFRITEAGGSVAVVLLLDDRQDGQQKLGRICRTTAAYFQKHFGVALFAGIGDGAYGLENLPNCYHTAMEELELLRFFRQDSFSVYHKKAYLQQKPVPEELIVRIENSLLTGETEQAAGMAVELLELLVLRQDIGIEQIKAQLHVFFGVLIRFNLKIQAVYPQMDKVNLFNIDDLYSKKDYGSIQNEVLHTIGAVGPLLREKGPGGLQAAAGEIAAYINRNYMDKNLNVNHISYVFGFSPSYLSKNFKRFMGKGILDYLNEVRVARAKELLLEGKKISDVSEQTGFTNSNALIRIFKKIEGITPGSFKEIHRGSQ